MTTADAPRQVGLLVLVALVVLLLLPLLFGGYGPMMGGHGPTMGMGTGGATAFPGWLITAVLLLQVLVVAVVVAGGYLLYRAFVRSSGDDSALEELRHAYARGDLTDEEYRERRETLRDES